MKEIDVVGFNVNYYRSADAINVTSFGAGGKRSFVQGSTEMSCRVEFATNKKLDFANFRGKDIILEIEDNIVVVESFTTTKWYNDTDFPSVWQIEGEAQKADVFDNEKDAVKEWL